MQNSFVLKLFPAFGSRSQNYHFEELQQMPQSGLKNDVVAI